jgi:hypothetical protein
MRKGLFSRTVLGIGALTLAGIVACSGKEQTSQPELVPVQRAQQDPETSEYFVKKGDYLSKILYKELGLRGNAIYDGVACSQKSTWSPEEISKRDTHKVVDGQLVEGQDGYVDLIHPDETVYLCR